MREKMKQRIVQYVVLMAGILALLLWLSLTIITGTGCLVINPLPQSKRMAIKAQIRMIAVATGITWPISVRIFLILWMEMWIYI